MTKAAELTGVRGNIGRWRRPNGSHTIYSVSSLIFLCILSCEPVPNFSPLKGLDWLWCTLPRTGPFSILMGTVAIYRIHLYRFASLHVFLLFPTLARNWPTYGLTAHELDGYSRATGRPATLWRYITRLYILRRT